MATTVPAAMRHRPTPMSSRASADLLIDRARLSELVGRDVRALRLRFKPGLSTSAALVDTAGAEPPHWIQVSHDAHLDKLRNALELARDRAQRVHLVRTGDLTIVHGDIGTDPRLQKGLDGLRTLHPCLREAVAMGDLQVLRYNPHRRLVLRRNLGHGDPEVIRITGHRQRRVDESLRRYQAAGVPLVRPDQRHVLAEQKRLTVWPWFGRGDLTTLRPEEAVVAARHAGAALRQLHGADLPGDRAADPTDRFAALVADLRALDAGAATRMERLVVAAGERQSSAAGRTGTVHGDFSADQVLVGRTGEDTVRLTDFDRAGRGALLADLGTFAAAELTTAPTGTRFHGADSLPLTRALLAGYTEAFAAPSVPTDDVLLRDWTARALLVRVTEPFRAGLPDWLEAIHGRLDQIEEMLS